MNRGPLHPAPVLLPILALVASAGQEAPAQEDPPRWESRAGPFHLVEESGGESRRSSFFPFYSRAEDPAIGQIERDVLYPLISYDRYGEQWRMHFLQILSLSGGGSQSHDWRRFTLFPFYFRQRSSDPEQDYRALFPFRGTLRNRLMHDRVDFTAFPLHVRTWKRDVVTDHWMMPFFHLRRGEQLSGWQLWPLAGWEEKGVTTRTNVLDEPVVSGGHRRFSLAWPLYFRDRSGIGTGEEKLQHALLPLFSYEASPSRRSLTAPWPLGLTLTRDEEKGYREWGLPWPLVVFARGEGKRTDRLWPLYGQSRNASQRRSFYLWPLWRTYRLETDHVVERRGRAALFLYRSHRISPKQGGPAERGGSLWPLYSRRSRSDGRTEIRVPALMDNFFPANETVERHYTAPTTLWSYRRSASGEETEASLLWDLYGRRKGKEETEIRVLFGLVRWRKDHQERSLRVLGARIWKRSRSRPGHVPTDR